MTLLNVSFAENSFELLAVGNLAHLAESLAHLHLGRWPCGTGRANCSWVSLRRKLSSWHVPHDIGSCEGIWEDLAEVGTVE